VKTAVFYFLKMQQPASEDETFPFKTSKSY